MAPRLEELHAGLHIRVPRLCYRRPADERSHTPRVLRAFRGQEYPDTIPEHGADRAPHGSRAGPRRRDQTLCNEGNSCHSAFQGRDRRPLVNTVIRQDGQLKTQKHHGGISVMRGTMRPRISMHSGQVLSWALTRSSRAASSPAASPASWVSFERSAKAGVRKGLQKCRMDGSESGKRRCAEARLETGKPADRDVHAARERAGT